MNRVIRERLQNDFIAHHGVKGQKWYHRRYQNEDGTLTPLGRIHYGIKKRQLYPRNERKRALTMLDGVTPTPWATEKFRLRITPKNEKVWATDLIKGRALSTDAKLKSERDRMEAEIKSCSEDLDRTKRDCVLRGNVGLADLLRFELSPKQMELCKKIKSINDDYSITKDDITRSEAIREASQEYDKEEKRIKNERELAQKKRIEDFERKRKDLVEKGSPEDILANLDYFTVAESKAILARLESE